MQKIKFILLLLFTASCMAFTYYATTWAGTSSNQMVTRQALNDAVSNGIFTAKQSFPNDLRLVTKAMAQAYVNIQTISGYDNNRLVPKSTFVSATKFYPHNVITLFWGDGTGGTTSSSSALAYLTTASGCIYAQDLYSYYSRALNVGDEIFFGANSSYYPALNTGSGSACATSYGSGWWIYDPSQNCALEVTNSSTGRQYIITKVFPSSLTNNSICISGVYNSSTNVTITATASSAVNTTVVVYFTYSINGGSTQYGNVSIYNGNTVSGSTTISSSSSIYDLNLNVYDFSPSSSSTQNYIYSGQCF